MKSLLCFILIALAMFPGCKQRAPEEELMHAAFSAFQTKDWNALKPLIITASDFDLGAQNLVGPLKSQLGYSGEFRKEEYEAQERLFEDATAGGDDLIDFAETEYVGLGQLMGEDRKKLLSGATVPVRTYSFKVKNKRTGEEDAGTLPYLALVSWGEKPRIFSIVVPPPEGTDEEFVEQEPDSESAGSAADEIVVPEAGE